ADRLQAGHGLAQQVLDAIEIAGRQELAGQHARGNANVAVVPKVTVAYQALFEQRRRTIGVTTRGQRHALLEECERDDRVIAEITPDAEAVRTDDQGVLERILMPVYRREQAERFGRTALIREASGRRQSTGEPGRGGLQITLPEGQR